MAERVIRTISGGRACRNGLARIYGTRTDLWDGRKSKQYNDRLAELEAEAKKAKRGGWRFEK